MVIKSVLVDLLVCKDLYLHPSLGTQRSGAELKWNIGHRFIRWIEICIVISFVVVAVYFIVSTWPHGAYRRRRNQDSICPYQGETQSVWNRTKVINTTFKCKTTTFLTSKRCFSFKRNHFSKTRSQFITQWLYPQHFQNNQGEAKFFRRQVKLTTC